MRAEARQPKLIINFAADQKQIRLDMTLSPTGPGAAQGVIGQSFIKRKVKRQCG